MYMDSFSISLFVGTLLMVSSAGESPNDAAPAVSTFSRDEDIKEDSRLSRQTSEGAATRDICYQDFKVVESPPCYDACEPLEDGDGPWILVFRGSPWRLLKIEFCRPRDYGKTFSYEKGFGHYGVDSEYYFMGLEKMHRYTAKGKWQVALIFTYKKAPLLQYNIYDGFKVDGKLFKYTAHVGPRIYQHNNSTDYLSSINGKPFSAFRENRCASEFVGGWWYSENCDYGPNYPPLVMSGCITLSAKENRPSRDFAGAVIAIRRVR